MSASCDPQAEFYRFGTKLNVPKGTEVYNSSRSDGNLFCFFLDSGCCALSSLSPAGEERTFLYFQGKQVIGFTQLLPVRNRSDSLRVAITTKTHCILYRVTSDTFHSLLSRSIAFCEFIVKTLSDNYIDLLNHYYASQTLCATLRLCNLLLEYAQPVSGDLVLPSYFTHEELSHYLGLHVVTVSHIMSQLKRKGYIQRWGRRIIIPDPDRLRNLDPQDLEEL